MGGMLSGGRRIAAAVRQHPWIAAWLTMVPVVLLRAGTLAESDTFWQIRTGLLTMSNRAIPTLDPFSWTANGEPWTLNSWGFNVLIAIAYRVAGLPAVALATAAMALVALALALVLARMKGAHPALAAVFLHVSFALLVIYFSARPQLIDYVAVLLLVLLLGRLVEESGSTRWGLAAIAGLTVVWVNLHAAAPLGLAIIGATTVLVALNPATRSRSVWCFAALLVAAVASLANPYGTGVLTQAVRVADASTDLIIEWQPLNPADPLQMLAFVSGLLALVISVRRRDVLMVAPLAVTALGALGATRILPILVLVALPVLSAAATRPAVLAYIASRRRMLVQGAIVGLAALTVLAGVAATHFGRPDPTKYSRAVVQAIPTQCRLFNSYLLGGYVILERPDVRVSVDSRNDLYGVERVRRSLEAVAGRPGQQLADADCVMVPPTTGLAQRLADSDDWVTKESEDAAVLFVRR